MEGTREACFLGELLCRRPVLTDPVPSPRRALRPDAPVVCSGFGFDRLLRKRNADPFALENYATRGFVLRKLL